MEKHPERAVEKAVRGMLPKELAGPQDAPQAQGVRGPDHPHQAQQPVPFEITQVPQ